MAQVIGERVIIYTLNLKLLVEFSLNRIRVEVIEVVQYSEIIAWFMTTLQESFHERGTGFKTEGEREIAEFEKQFDINPILLVNIVLKF